MARPLKLFLKFATFCHRWMGVAFCLLFGWWFVSGIFIMYWSFPGVDEADRLARAPALDVARVRVTPESAAKSAGVNSPPDRIWLRMVDGHPAYFFDFGGRKILIHADDGSLVEAFTPGMNLRTAAAWTGQPASAATVEGLKEPDQWTVNMFDDIAPVTKYSWATGEQVYVSDASGDVVQYTTTASRFFGYLGPVAHWLYFTPLRKNGPLWSRIVIWASGAGTIMAIFGLVIGIWRYSPSKQFVHNGAPSSIPYRGQKRLHMILGLFFGIVVCTWTFSGMLSMEPFPRWSDSGIRPGGAGDRIGAALRGRTLDSVFASEFVRLSPSAAAARAGAELTIRELELASIVGQPVYVVRYGSRNASGVRLIPLDGAIGPEELRDRIAAAVREAAAPEMVEDSRLLTNYDAYYLDREKRKTLPVMRFQLSGEGRSTYYVDPATARLVGVYNSRGWPTRWLYHGLHSLDFPWLYRYRPAWDIVVLALMLGGTWLCVTSVIIGWRFLGKKVFRRGQKTKGPTREPARTALPG